MGIFKAQNSFTSGIISPAMFGRVDLPQYLAGASDIENFLVLPWGGLTRRGGLAWNWEAKSTAGNCRLFPFRYSEGSAYVIEAGAGYFRFGKNGQRLFGAGGPVEIDTPYTDAQIPELTFMQSADVIWIMHPDVATRKLLRYSDAEWYLQPMSFLDGPYLTVNTTPATLIASAETGTVTVTGAGGVSITNAYGHTEYIYIMGVPVPLVFVAVTTDAKHGLTSGDTTTISGVLGTTEANGTWTVSVIDDYNLRLPVLFSNPYTSGGSISPHIFEPTDVGRTIRIFYDDGTTPQWSWGEIVTYTNAYTVDAIVIEGKFPDGVAAPATTDWKLGKFSETTGYPAVGVLHQQRLGFAGSPAGLIDVDFSQTDILDSFQTALDLSILATDAMSYRLQSDLISPVRWMMTYKKGVAVGTDNGVWMLYGGGQNQAMSATDLMTADEDVGIGSSKLTPHKAGSALIFTDKSRRRVHEFAYNFNDDSYQAPDLSLLVDHLTRSTRIKETVWQASARILWVVCEDGSMIAMTYMREENVVAWQRITTDGTFVSATSVSDGERDVVYVIVDRQIGGSTARYIESFTDVFRGTQISDGFFLDAAISGVQETFSHNILTISNANPGALGFISHGRTTGDIVYISGATGLTALNGNYYRVLVVNASLLEIYDLAAVLENRITDAGLANWTPAGNNNVLETIPGTISIIYVDDATGASFDLGGLGTIGPLPYGAKFRLHVLASASGAGVYLNVNSSIGGLLGASSLLTASLVQQTIEFTADGGDIVLECSGMSAGGNVILSGNYLSLCQVVDSQKIDTTALGAYAGGGSISGDASKIVGLDHLEGQEVQVVGDGKLLPSVTVAGGIADLGRAVSQYLVGLPFLSRVVGLPCEINDLKSGTTLGRVKSVNNIMVKVHDSFYLRAGLMVRGVEQAIDEVPDFMVNTIIGEAPKLQDLDINMNPEGDYGTDVRFIVETDRPAPLNIAAVVTELNQEAE